MDGEKNTDSQKMGGIKIVQLTEKEQEAKSRVCLALDVPTVAEGLSLVDELSDYVGTFKVNSLHEAAAFQGINIVEEIRQRGGSTFLDLKYHDTPGTAFNYARDSVVPGVYVFNIHISGGQEMCEKTMEGVYKGSQETGLPAPKVIGVTELTSLDDNDLLAQGYTMSHDELVERRTELAKQWGLDGIVCPAKKAGDLEQKGYDFIKVTPGIKWAGVQNIGQKQLYTPDQAVEDCQNSILVIGSAITKAGADYDENKTLIKPSTPESRIKASYEILQAMAQKL